MPYCNYLRLEHEVDKREEQVMRVAVSKSQAKVSERHSSTRQ